MSRNGGWLVVAAVAAMAVPGGVQGQVQRPVRVAVNVLGAAPCCNVMRVDPRGAAAAVKDANTGKTIDLRPNATIPPIAGARFIASLRAGQRVWVDYARGRASVDGKSFCCTVGSGHTVVVAATYGQDSAAHAGECDAQAKTAGVSKCYPVGTVTASGKEPDGSDDTRSWTCVCT